MAFGWSAGDILSAINFIITIANALDEVSGSAKEFREASSFLRDLNSALTPLQTFTALDTEPAYKSEIQKQVEAIKTPIEKFIDDKDVKELQKNLGVVNESRFRHVQNMKSKLKWHFIVSDKALALQKDVERHLKIVDTLIQRLTVDILHTLQSSFRGDVGKSLEERLNIQLPLLQTTLLEALSQRDESIQATWQAQLENLLESYLGSQRIQFSSSPATTIAAETVYTPKMLKEAVSHFKLKLPPPEVLVPSRIPGGFQAAEEIVTAVKSWWCTQDSDIIWIQNCSRELDEPSVARDLVAFAKESREITVLAYSCRRVDADGLPFDKAEQFVDMLYSFIGRLCTSIMEDFSTSLDLSASRFSTLDGRPESAGLALELFGDLISVISGPALVVLEEVEVLDFSNDATLERNLERLIYILRSEKGNVVIKTFLTTVENSLLVMDAVGWERTVDASLGSGSEEFLSLEELKAPWS